MRILSILLLTLFCIHCSNPLTNNKQGTPITIPQDSITPQLKQYHYMSHHNETSFSKGITLSYTPPNIGTYVITYKKPDFSPYSMVTNRMRISSESEIYSGRLPGSSSPNRHSTMRSVVTSTYTGQQFIVSLSPYCEFEYGSADNSYCSNTDLSFFIYADTAQSLTMEKSVGGVGYPYGTTYGAKNDSITLYSETTPGYHFDLWKIASNKGILPDSSTVILSEDIVVTPQYTRNPTHTITGTATEFNIPTHASNQDYTEGVFFEYTSTGPDTVLFSLRGITPDADITLEEFVDSTYQHRVKHSLPSNSTQTLEAVFSKSGETKYFHARGGRFYHSDANDFFTVVAGKKMAFEMTSTENGHTSHSHYYNESFAHGDIITTYAWPDEGYIFSHWEVLNGTPVINNPNSPEAEITLFDSTGTDDTIKIMGHFSVASPFN